MSSSISQIAGASNFGSPTTSLSSPLTFRFLSINLSILNCSVYGPQSQKYFDVVTNDEVSGQTLFYDHDSQARALIDWEVEHPELEVYGVVPRQSVNQWLALNESKTYRLMEMRGRQYRWSPCGNDICLYKIGQSTPSEVFAQICQREGTIMVDMTTQALQAGLLEILVIATVLFQSSRTID